MLTAAAASDQGAQVETTYEQLIVFRQPGASHVDQLFEAEQLPPMRQIAESMGVSLHVVDARQGAPPEIALTPLIVYQNHRGRSIYQGRTNTPDRVRNFIRTSRFVPQGAEPNRRSDIPVWQMGRGQIWAPLKVSSVSGTPPEDYNDQTFRAEALEAISQGFTQFKMN